jgi:hypothetical protein
MPRKIPDHGERLRARGSLSRVSVELIYDKSMPYSLTPALDPTFTVSH